MVRPRLRQQWRRHQLRLRLLRAVHDDSAWGRRLVCTESVEPGVWPGKKQSKSPGLVAGATASESRSRIADTANSERLWLFAQLDVGVLDDLRPFGDVGVDDSREFVWCADLDLQAELRQAL